MTRREALHAAGLRFTGALLPSFSWRRRSPAPPALHFSVPPTQPYTAADFGPGFVWGTATAAYQVEGFPAADGRMPSIWDTFSHSRSKTAGGYTGDVACEHYTHYPEDLALLHGMGLRHYRFSLSWSRILPQGTGAVNPVGVAFYQRLIAECHRLGITPWLTRYHWDLPQTLQDQGGWQNRTMLDWFSHYV